MSMSSMGQRRDVATGVMDHGRALHQHGGDARLAQGRDERITVGDQELGLQPGEPRDLAKLVQHGVIGIRTETLEVGQQPGHEPLRGQIDTEDVEPPFPFLKGGEGALVRSQRRPQQQLVARH